MRKQPTNSPCSTGFRSQKLEPEYPAVVIQATAELRRSSYAALRRVECDFQDGVLTLRGRVPNYYEKQIAQTLVQFRLPSVVIRNELTVCVHNTDESGLNCTEEPALA